MLEKPDNQREGSDEALIVRYQRGDRAALSVLVRRHARALFSTAYYVVGSNALASNLTLDTFRQVLEQAGSFHIEMHFRTWLFGFLHQQLLVQSERSGTEMQPDSLSVNGSDSTALPKMGRSQLLNRRIAEAVASLPSAARETVVLKLVGQLTISELAAAMNVDPDVVRENLRVALGGIRDAISDTEDYARALR